MNRSNKVRLPKDSKWVAVPSSVRSLSGQIIGYSRLQLSTEFKQFALENFGHYRYQCHDRCITVIFENPADAVWMRMLVD
jgi:hypothetical protein